MYLPNTISNRRQILFSVSDICVTLQFISFKNSLRSLCICILRQCREGRRGYREGGLVSVFKGVMCMTYVGGWVQARTGCSHGAVSVAYERAVKFFSYYAVNWRHYNYLRIQIFIHGTEKVDGARWGRSKCNYTSLYFSVFISNLFTQIVRVTIWW